MKILITGVGGPLGKKIVSSLLKNNYEVVAISRSASSLESHKNLITIDANLGNKEEVFRVAETISNYDIKTFIANSTGGSQNNILKNDEYLWENWHYGLSVEVLSQLIFIKTLAKNMQNSSGQVINITSLAGHYPESGSYAYGAAKAASSYLTKLVNSELPFMRSTEVVLGTLYDEDRKIEASVDMDDVVKAILFLINTSNNVKIPKIEMMNIHQRPYI